MAQKHTEASLRKRYAAIVAEAQQIRTDLNAWNAMHPECEPLTVDLNFEAEVRAAREKLRTRGPKE